MPLTPVMMRLVVQYQDQKRHALIHATQDKAGNAKLVDIDT